MGRYNFAPLRHRSVALQKLDSRRITQTPTWYNALTTVPVSQILVRQRPTPHPILKTRARQIGAKDSKEIEQYTFTEMQKRPHKSKKKSRGKAKLFKPVPVSYEEDTIRTLFYSDHPWELARPRMILEQSGDDVHNNRLDWSRGVIQPGKFLNGESCIQRILYLLQNVADITLEDAYDKSRKEFYSARLEEDVERRVAPEEASHFGVDFEPSILEKGMQQEDKAYEEWRKWAIREQEMRLQQRLGMAAPPMRGGAEAEDTRNRDGRSRDTRGVRGTMDDHGDGEMGLYDSADDLQSLAIDDTPVEQQAPP
ncbi:MAG: hypothetical protein Q9160_007237 [Pyrenula sp. 1 TL-2023]